MTNDEREFYRDSMLALLKLRKDMRYRRGVIQMAVLAQIITDKEWKFLDAQVVVRIDKPFLARTDHRESSSK